MSSKTVDSQQAKVLGRYNNNKSLPTFKLYAIKFVQQGRKSTAHTHWKNWTNNPIICSVLTKAAGMNETRPPSRRSGTDALLKNEPQTQDSPKWLWMATKTILSSPPQPSGYGTNNIRRNGHESFITSFLNRRNILDSDWCLTVLTIWTSLPP